MAVKEAGSEADGLAPCMNRLRIEAFQALLERCLLLELASQLLETNMA